MADDVSGTSPQPGRSDRVLLGKKVRYIDAIGIQQIGTLDAIVTEPSYIISTSWSDGPMVIAQSKVENLRCATCQDNAIAASVACPSCGRTDD